MISISTFSEPLIKEDETDPIDEIEEQIKRLRFRVQTLSKAAQMVTSKSSK